MSRYDVVIAGSGITGALLANRLSQHGLRVLILEAGDRPYFDPVTGRDQREALLERFAMAPIKGENDPYPDLDYAPSAWNDSPQEEQAYLDQPKEPFFATSYTRIAGGTTYHWLGTSLRLLPSDFRMRSTYGRAVDWPLAYDDLVPWYEHAERALGVAGDAAADLGAPRHGAPYPMPPIPLSYADRRTRERLAGMTFDGMPVLVQSTPQARNSMPYEDRPPCAGSNNCIPICPIQAKYDATVHLKRALNPALDPYRRASSVPAEIRYGAVVTRVTVGADGQVNGMVYKSHDDRRDHVVTARRYVLAMHAIEVPKVLLASRTAALPHGVANTSGCVGRYLMDHDVSYAYGLADEPLYQFRGPVSSAGIESLRDGPFRRRRSAFRIQLQNQGTGWATVAPYTDVWQALGKGALGGALRRTVAWNVSRQVELDVLFEPDPVHESTVTLSKQLDAFGIPRPKVHYRVGEYTVRGRAAFERLARKVFKAMGEPNPHFGPVEGKRNKPIYYGAGHVMGTFRMGASTPSGRHSSVTDTFGRTHDHPNLYLTGSGLFPTVGTANPTLTITALTLRTADHLVAELAAGG